MRRWLWQVERRLPSRLRYIMWAWRDAADWRRLDAEDNEHGRIPADEQIRLHSIWISECYAPSHAKALVDGLRRLGFRRYGDEAPASSVAADRHLPGTWRRLGLLVGRDRRYFGTDRVRTNLPAEVLYGRASVETLSTALTVLTVQFVLTDQPSRELRAVLERDYTTRTRYEAGRFVTHRPSNQRRARADQRLDALRTSCGAWIARHIPGVFSGGLPSTRFPTCLFLSLAKAEPFAGPQPHSWDSYLSILRLDHDYDVWSSVEFPSLQLLVPSRSPVENWLLASREQFEVDDKGRETYGGRSQDEWTGRLDYPVSRLMPIHAAQTALSGFHGLVSETRDALRSKSGGWLASPVKELQSDLGRLVQDVHPVASGLAEADDGMLQHERPGFVPGAGHWLSRMVERQQDVTNPSRVPFLAQLQTTIGQLKGTSIKIHSPKMVTPLAQWLSAGIRQSAARLIVNERMTRDALRTAADMRVAGETLRLNRRLVGLTLVLIVLTVVIAALTWVLVLGAPLDTQPTPLVGVLQR